MARTFSEEERLELINAVGKYYLYGFDPSCRKCAKYLNDKGKSISYVTVKDYLDRFMKMNPETVEYIHNILNGNKPKTVEDENVKNRVLLVSNMVANGLSIDEVVNQTGYTKDTIHNDITKRIFLTDVDLGLKVKYVLENYKISNLMQGNDAYLNQERNSDGTFKK